MHEIATVQNVILAMSPESIEKVRSLESEAMKLPQTAIETTHTFHAGVYARTVKIPSGVVITGALIKIPTVLIVSGNFVMFTDGEPKDWNGYHVFSASAGRKQAFVAITDTYLTMLFSTDAKNVSDAEREFTDEFDLLITNKEAV